MINELLIERDELLNVLGEIYTELGLTETNTLGHEACKVTVLRAIRALRAGNLEDRSLEAVKKAHILRVLAEQSGNKLAAAKVLGVSLKTLYNRLAHYSHASRAAI